MTNPAVCAKVLYMEITTDHYEAHDREYDETQELLDMTMSERIKNECYSAYTISGQTAVFAFIKKNYPLIPWEWCKPCESDSPMLGDECLVCGTKRDTLPPPEDIIRDYTEWVRKGGCVGYDGHVESANTSLGSLTVTYADGTMLRLNMTAEYVGNRDHAE